MRVAPPRALDEQRAAAAISRPDERPALELGLGDEAHRLQRVEHEDVEPRDVIRDEQQVAGQLACVESADIDAHGTAAAAAAATSA